jgi:branched-chain amino acid transport system permease protein
MSGVLLAPIYSVFPTMGRDFVLIAFSVVIIGGMGSIKGAVIAGLLLTQVQSISSLFISPVWSDPLLFSIMVAGADVAPARPVREARSWLTPGAAGAGHR